jgi:hypothetical protein
MKRTLALGGLGTKTGKKHPSHNSWCASITTISAMSVLVSGDPVVDTSLGLWLSPFCTVLTDLIADTLVARATSLVSIGSHIYQCVRC